MTIAAYRASHQALVTVRDSADVGALVHAFVQAAGDAPSVERISLEIDDPTDLQRGAREAAYRDAEAKASQDAQLAGRVLGPVTSLAEGWSVAVDAGATRSSMGKVFAAAGAVPSAMPIEPGESTVRAMVTVRWAFRP